MKFTNRKSLIRKARRNILARLNEARANKLSRRHFIVEADEDDDKDDEKVEIDTEVDSTDLEPVEIETSEVDDDVEIDVDDLKKTLDKLASQIGCKLVCADEVEEAKEDEKAEEAKEDEKAEDKEEDKTEDKAEDSETTDDTEAEDADVTEISSTDVTDISATPDVDAAADDSEENIEQTAKTLSDMTPEDWSTILKKLLQNNVTDDVK